MKFNKILNIIGAILFYGGVVAALGMFEELTDEEAQKKHAKELQDQVMSVLGGEEFQGLSEETLSSVYSAMGRIEARRVANTMLMTIIAVVSLCACVAILGLFFMTWSRIGELKHHIQELQNPNKSFEPTPSKHVEPSADM